jgi:uncharacterized protein YyaL (SSP411 family)
MRVLATLQYKTRHLVRLTDSTGIIQHGIYGLPDLKTGYTLDDNARALTVTFQLYEKSGEQKYLELCETYLSFLAYAQRPDGLWRNFAGYDRNFLEDCGSEDSFGRAVQALCPIAASSKRGNLVEVARKLLRRASCHIAKLSALRAQAFTLAGLASSQPQLPQISELADELVETYKANATEGWHWFEDQVTYCNGILPESLLWAWKTTEKEEYLKIGLKSLSHLTVHLLSGEHLQLVGNRGWWKRGSRIPKFDQQPIDAYHMAQAHLVAWRVTGKKEHLKQAQRCLRWFEGDNSLGLSLIDPETGGIYDGLTPSGVNRNCGAESVIAYLLTDLAMEKAGQLAKKAG